jgi:tryptophanyl-tRNA synthetase
MARERIFSGIQPSGELHLGNWLGAVRNWVDLQDEYDCVYCVVDYHAITQDYPIDEFRRRTLEMAAWLMACGIDTERSRLFVQSQVPQHTELCWILGTVTPMGELGRMTQFKDKARRQKQNVNSGLFLYPVLQAADILLYKAEAVPVGRDQEQHLELSRIIARKFNARFGRVFPEPQPLFNDAGRIVGLDGKEKMSKSLGNTVALSDSPDDIWDKLRPAVTDPARVRRTDPGTPEKCNIYSLHQHLSPEEEIAEVAEGCRTAGIGCFQCKKVLHRHMVAALAPIRERGLSLAADLGGVERILAASAELCRAVADETLGEVREKLGIDRDAAPSLE